MVDRLARQVLSHNIHSLTDYVPDLSQLSHQRLVSRKPFPRHAARLVSSNFSIQHLWNVEWEQTPCPSQFGVTPDTTAPAGARLPRKLWVTLNRLRSGVGRFGDNMHRWGLRDTAACACGADVQTAQHIIFDCPVLFPPYGLDDLKTPDPASEEWLQRLSNMT